MLARIRQFIRENRRLAALSWTAAVAEKYLHAYYNEGFYDFRRNGERYAINTFAAWNGDRNVVVWDIGANSGQWVLEALEVMPSAEFHSFEVLPQIYDELVSRIGGPSNVQAHCLGLSDATGQITVQFNPKHNTTSSISPRLASQWFADGVQPVVCEVATADELAERLGRPNLLKIDVEGHDVAVLRGAQNLLASPDGPDMIQVEYGETYLPFRSTLKDVYDLVTPHGYAVGRLYPNHVDFRPYAYGDDNFRMGNFIAVRPPRLREMLTARGGS